MSFKPLARIISSVTDLMRWWQCDVFCFKPLARIISSVTSQPTSTSVPPTKFQTACANYFLCDLVLTALLVMLVVVSNRLRELFPL